MIVRRADRKSAVGLLLAERLQMTPDEAFVVLRRYARNQNHPLTELTRDVIRGTAPIVRAPVRPAFREKPER